ncbi:MAG: sel1 repeat family protein [Gammaproteobacteria bacterium]|nr:MAG: sel1 repeat family protein [Gammaproteobacteria bacterium]
MYQKLLAVFLVCLSATSFAGFNEAQSAFKKGDYQGAVQEYIRMGNAGDTNAQLILGALYSKGGAVPRDEKTAIFWLEKSSLQGNMFAQYLLGQVYENSQLPNNYQQASIWYKKAAQQGQADAQVRLGHFYSQGLGIAQNYNEAILWLGRAALQNNVNAQQQLGLMYLNGKGLPKSPQVATGWFSKAAAQKNDASLLLLADIYKDGDGTDKKPVLAYALYELAVIHQTELQKEAIKKRDGLAKTLNSQQIDDAEKLAEELNKPNNFSKTLTAYLKRSEQLFRFFPDK